MRLILYLLKIPILILFFIVISISSAIAQESSEALQFDEIARFGRGISEQNIAYDSFLLSPDKTYIAVDTNDGIEVWDLNTQSLTAFIHDPYGIYDFGVFAWSPDSTQIATITLDTQLDIWDISTGELVRTYKGIDLQSNGVRAIEWYLPDVVTTGSFEYLRWSIETENSPQIVNCHPYGSLLWWSPNRRYIATIGGESTLVWICDSEFERQFSIEGYTTVAWSPNSNKIATVGIFNTLRVWSLSTGEVLSTSNGGDNNILEISWHSEGHRIATRHLNGEIRIWEQLTPDTFWLVGDVYVPELSDAAWLGNQLITASSTGIIQLWNLN